MKQRRAVAAFLMIAADSTQGLTSRQPVAEAAESHISARRWENQPDDGRFSCAGRKSLSRRESFELRATARDIDVTAFEHVRFRLAHVQPKGDTLTISNTISAFGNPDRRTSSPNGAKYASPGQRTEDMGKPI